MPLEMQQLQRPEQRMILTPQMQQAIHLLQLPLLELRTIIQQEIVQNPLLEEVPPREEPLPEESAETSPGAQEELEFREEFDRLARIDDEWKEYFRQTTTYARYRGPDEETKKFLEDSVTKGETLAEHLLKQLGISVISEEDQKIGEAIIGCIDENGYLTDPLKEIARSAGIDPERAKAVLAVIQTFHPLGVGARDLRESLLIQIRSLERSDPLARIIVERHLEDLGRNKYPQIARALKTSSERVQKAAGFIATLDPKPGRMFTSGETQYITPDIYLEQVNGDYQIIFNSDYLPRLRINNQYRELMHAKKTAPETKKYIKEKVTAGLWLVKNIRLRQETLHKITREIVKRQKRFLDQGLAYLQPLKMSELAGVIGIHESTVSRAVANKYIQTPQGTFQLKYFFTTAIPAPLGGQVSSTNVKRLVARMIKEENHSHPLSDQEIAEVLARRGIKLARRTVAKYRKNLHILPSHLRKKY
jgi:RNA polymerase sigma-54 factor